MVAKMMAVQRTALYVRGGGDPFLISEELAPLATGLVAVVGKKPIDDIVLDASHYPSNLRIPGIEETDESYNALNSALAVNFNTVSAVRDGDKVRPAGLKPVYVHQSPTLSKILADLLRASNNYVANQVFLEIGAHRLGGPVSLGKSLQVANEMLAAHGLADAIHLEEGSGISRNNRFSARGLAKVLALFAPHADLLHGHDGGKNKTGTLEGVCTLAGYADTSSHGRVRFVISLATNDGEMRFRLLRAIESGL